MRVRAGGGKQSEQRMEGTGAGSPVALGTLNSALKPGLSALTFVLSKNSKEHVGEICQKL